VIRECACSGAALPTASRACAAARRGGLLRPKVGLKLWGWVGNRVLVMPKDRRVDVPLDLRAPRPGEDGPACTSLAAGSGASSAAWVGTPGFAAAGACWTLLDPSPSAAVSERSTFGGRPTSPSVLRPPEGRLRQRARGLAGDEGLRCRATTGSLSPPKVDQINAAAKGSSLERQRCTHRRADYSATGLFPSHCFLPAGSLNQSHAAGLESSPGA
jgi:hypothetical protein